MLSDSLVDIVSNVVGIFVILTACFALLAASRSAAPAIGSGTANPGRPQVTVTLEWPRASQKNTVFAALTGGRVQVLELDALYERLLQHPRPRQPQTVTVSEPGMDIRFYPITNEAYCFQFRPHEDSGETPGAARLAGSAWQQALDRYPSDKYAFFFWVTPDSFAPFRTLRDSMRNDGLDVDWKPVPADAPLEVCQGIEGARGLEPQ
jgi:hypothetical protein